MIVLGLVLSVAGIGLFCWVLFTLTVYALPFFAGLTAGFAAYHSGSGVLGALLVGVFAGAATLVVGQIAFATIRSPFVRALIALLFAVPAAVAGYHATLGLTQIGVPSHAWRETFAVVGAIVTGVMAWVRIVAPVGPGAGQSVGIRPAHASLPAIARNG